MLPSDLKIECWPTYKAGMHVGIPKGIKITHKLSGITVTCNSERSQHQNQQKALEAMAEKLKIVNVNKFIETIDARFKSGNDIPVERAHITAAEWARLREIIFTLGRVAAGDCEEVPDEEE